MAWYSWKTTHDPRLPGMIAQGEVKNMVDLCYQTLALAEIDRTKYAAQIRANAERILCSAAPERPVVDALRPQGARGGVSDRARPVGAGRRRHSRRTSRRCRRRIQYLLNRQQAFGGWMDPTAILRELQDAVPRDSVRRARALHLLPARRARQGMGLAGAAIALHRSGTPAHRTRCAVGPPVGRVLHQLEAAAQSNEVLVRQAAVEALGRLALPATVPLLVKLLEDPSKLVQRTAAWSLRQVYGAHPDTGDRELLAALASPSARMRWGATRVFAHHFAALARRDDLVTALDSASPTTPCSPSACRPSAACGRRGSGTPAFELRGRIEDTLLAGLAQPQHPWIETNLRAAIYNLADENIRYLYNNWVALLGRPEDRDRAIQGRLAVESQLAVKFAGVLEHGPDAQKKQLLAALAELPLRRGDVYDLAPAAGDEIAAGV